MNQTLDYTTDSVVSADGTTVGYRQLGSGPGLILVHGAMQASQNLMKLAAALSDAFTLYVVDRRGRGLTGPYGENVLQSGIDDIAAVLDKTGAHYVFGLSAGALISLESALTLRAIHKLALYEPPVPVDDTFSREWVARYDRELAEGKLAAAMVTAARGTMEFGWFNLIPRFILERMLSMAIDPNSAESQGDEAPLAQLIPTVHYDAQMVFQIPPVETFKTVSADVLLMGGSKSPVYLKHALDYLEVTLPHVRRVELKGVGHIAPDNGGRPEWVARELRTFFGEQNRTL